MCNIAGYVGENEATPILLEMIKKQEGLNGGFFTGLATHNGDSLCYRKVQGELATLLKETDADRLKGNMGIIHSRTPSGGNELWAHPFVTERNGIVKMCYVANGSRGIFKGNREKVNQIADRLMAENFDIPCKIDFEGDKYCRLSGGEAVHTSDVMCQLIYKYKQNVKDTVSAMTSAFTEIPGEIVGLVIEEESSDRIYFSRINMPMFVGFDDHGAYLASSPIAFPNSVKNYKLLPPLSSGVVFKDHYEVTNYGEFPIEVASFNDETVEDTESLILTMLKAQECSYRDIVNELKKNDTKELLMQYNAIVYIALSNLLDRKEIVMRSIYRTVDGQSAPKTLFRLT